MLMEEIKENLYKWRDILLKKREYKRHRAQRDEANTGDCPCAPVLLISFTLRTKHPQQTTA